MDVSSNISVSLLVCVIVGLLVKDAIGAAGVERTTYIVHMNKHAMPTEFSTHEHWYKSMLSSVKQVTQQQNGKGEDLYLYVYDNVMHGFSARLTQAELDVLQKMPGHVLSFADPVGSMDTTHSTEFLGLTPDSGLLPISRFGQDVIVGVMDTGVWPESRSFLDDGMEPVPARWKGSCDNGTDFDPSLCNKKLIGARYFNKGVEAKYGQIDPVDDYDSARDFEGHGSHTSSTIGGNYVDNVDFYGFASGTARGVAPAGRVAMYKVLWTIGAVGSDVLAGMESAINDGADVLSLSLGFDSTPYFQDSIAIGAFEAIKKGIVVVCSAGNDGPSRGIMHNGAPWIFTVGASTIDRDYGATVKLGDGTVVNGSSYFVYSMGDRGISQAPLMYEKEDPACKNLNLGTINGSVLLCVNMSNSLLQNLTSARVRGLIWVTDQESYAVSLYNFPVAVLKSEDAASVVSYASSAVNAVVDINFNITALGIKPAPAVASFSSRGPYGPSPTILKPDIIAPGYKILAAWRGNLTGSTDYNMISGTSMSCPHVAGVSALVKAVHTDWSPAAIRSAIMTTSYTLDNSNNTFIDLGDLQRSATPLDFGAGHVDPQKAIDPGLVYDLSVDDYVNFLCTLNYTVQQIEVISGTSVVCPSGVDFGSDTLNYPSFTAIFSKNNTSSSSKTFKRILKNVGDDMSYYNAVVEVPKGLNVRVYPDVLEFKQKFGVSNFTVTVEVEAGMSVGNEDVVYGYLSWVDGKGHVVKSPVVALFE